jgi:DNA-damage-inducible protein J
MTDTVIRSRIDSRVKMGAAKVFKEMGLTLSQAIRLFLYQAVAEQRLPFAVKTPTAVTHAALQELSHPGKLEKTSLSELEQDWDDA